MDKTFERIVANIGADKALVRNESLEGRDYLVVPMVMLTEGVHQGSNGPLYYPPDELAKAPVVWNHKPVVIYHPERNGMPVSACDPDVINTRKVGIIMNTKFESGKLKSEAWLDMKRLKEVDERVVISLDEKKPVSVSTGLFTDNEATDGEWNGEKYIAIARNYRPDHLAILPDQKAACSIEDGAGLLMNALHDHSIKKHDHKLLQALVAVANQLSHDDIRGKLQSLVSAGDGPDDFTYVVEVFANYVVFRRKEKFYWQDYERKQNEISLVGRAEEVEQVTKYVPVSKSTKFQTHKETIMANKELIDSIIGNEALPWSEDNRSMLEAMSEVQLQVVANAAEEKEEEKEKEKEKEEEEKEKEKDTRNQQNPQPVTLAEYIAQAPEGVREVLVNSMQVLSDEKAKLIGIITSNKANSFTKEALQAKPLGELKALAALAASTKPAVNFDGMGFVADPTVNTEEGLKMPSVF